MISGFEVDPINGFQKSDQIKGSKSLNALDSAMPESQNAVINVMKNNSKSPYKDYSATRATLTEILSENYYALPKQNK